MSAIRLANSTCSWGVLEFEGMKGGRLDFERVLDELKETQYEGTDFGDWGFMPTEPARLAAALAGRNLEMVSAYVPVALAHEKAHAAGEADAIRVATLLAAAAQRRPGTAPPFLVLADHNGTDPVRTRHAGRITADMSLDRRGWEVFARGAERVARAVREWTGLRTVFHHHCAGCIETPDEIGCLMERTDPEVVGLVFDTGHYLYGTGGTDPARLREGLDRFADRIRLVHFKDCHPRVAARAREEGWDYFGAVRRGLFCELGQGCIDFADVTAWLRSRSYAGWVVVEQDVLPGTGTPCESARRNRELLRTLSL